MHRRYVVTENPCTENDGAENRCAETQKGSRSCLS
jgi:hypothetical protein